MNAVLSISNLCKSFGTVKVADEMSFDVPMGQSLGIIGPNGAGKTSLFNLISGTFRADSGTITYLGSDISSSNSAARCRAGIARSFQIPQPFIAMSVFENVLVGATQGAGMPQRDAETVCLEILVQTGLLSRANDLAATLTLLERKRLELARALAANPKLLLLDEIAGGLTEIECQSLISTINDIKSSGITIIWIEHIVHALLAVVDRLIVIDFGRMIADGEPKPIMKSTQVREIYMGLDADA
jgi:branched-chain amino acid transport system ATP-binding protein